MSTLVDTGVLLRAFDANFNRYRSIRQALRKALDEGERLVVTIQKYAGEGIKVLTPEQLTQAET